MKLNRKQPQGRGDMPPAVSFEVSEPGSRHVSPLPSNHRIPSPLSSPSSCRQIPVDLKASGLKSREHSQASLPSSTTRRVTADKRSSSVTTSRNSSMNSLLLLGFEDAEVFRNDQDSDGNLARRIKAGDMRLIAKKRQEIIQIQRLLTHQQKIYICLYAQIKDLEARAGLEPGDCLGDMRMWTMKGWPPQDLLLLVMDHPASKKADRTGVLESALLDELTSELSSIPKEFLTMGADLTARRTRLLEYVRKRIPSELKTKNEFDTETEVIHKMIFESAKLMDTKISRSLEIAKTSWNDRELLLKKIDRLNKELAVFQGKLKPSIDEDEEDEKPSNDQNKKNDPTNKWDSLHDLREKLNKARSARESMKNTVATAEGMLRTARARITVLERELKQALKQLEAAVRKHKEYEILHRCRETSYDVRSKKLLQVSKTGEETIEMLSLQRDALELRVKELQDEVKSVIADYELRESKHQTCLDGLQEKVDEQERQKKLALARGMELEKRIKDMQDQYRQLQEQSEKLIKINNEKCLDLLPHKESEPTKRETELWSELQLTKKTLARVEDELKQSREDKEGLLNSLAKIAQEGSENNMANELLLREQKNFQLQQVIETLKENLNSMNEALAQKDNQLMALKREAIHRNYECCSKDTPKQELALDVIDLSTQVTNLTRERESLITAANTRALMLERHERCAELFAQVTRARRDVAAYLDNSRAEHERPQHERPSSEGAFRDANLSNSLSSSCLKAAKTWEELRTDRERVQQLQEVVALQTLQLQREGRIRNQLEQRRAVLERLFLNRASPDQYVPAENVAGYFGTSSYFVNDAFMNAS